MGIEGKRIESERLTWPEELASEPEPLAPLVNELALMYDRLHVSECKPPFADRHSVLKKILIQDTYSVRLAKELFPRMDSGFFSVYLRAIDVTDHLTIPFREGAPVPEGCPETVRDVMDEVYAQNDAWLSEILDALPKHATVIVVSDHGMQRIQNLGNHAPFGILLASVGGIRRQVAERLDSALMRTHERVIILQVVDSQWKDHLCAMDHPKEGIGLRGYGQRGPQLRDRTKSVHRAHPAAVSAASSLAVELADSCHVGLVGFLQGDVVTVYTGSDRVG